MKSKKLMLSVVIGTILVLSLFIFFQNRPTSSNITTGAATFKGYTAEVFYSPTCGCCVNYIDYLRNNGFEVKITRISNPNEIKYDFNIPQNLWSCHTTKIDKYFVEGHVPVEAIEKLLDEKLDIDGIALPAMPPGSPGMPGIKAAPFVIYAINNGQSQGVFVRT